MGFGGFVKKAAKKVSKAVKKKAPRVVAGVVTGGTTEVLRRTKGGKRLAKLAESTLAPTSTQDLSSGLALVTNPAATIGQTLAGEPTPQGGGDVGNFLGGVAGILNTTSGLGGNIGTISQIGSGFLSGFLPAQGPVAGRSIATVPQAIPTMAAAPPIIRGATSAVMGVIGPILADLSARFGKNITLRAAMIIIRRLAKVIQSPAGIATAMGISIGALEQILVANSIQGTQGRRMNPGNVKALRRAHRRINSFHKLCGENDRLRTPRRRRAPSKSVVVCK